MKRTVRFLVFASGAAAVVRVMRRHRSTTPPTAPPSGAATDEPSGSATFYAGLIKNPLVVGLTALTVAIPVLHDACSHMSATPCSEHAQAGARNGHGHTGPGATSHAPANTPAAASALTQVSASCVSVVDLVAAGASGGAVLIVFASLILGRVLSRTMCRLFLALILLAVLLLAASSAFDKARGNTLAGARVVINVTNGVKRFPLAALSILLVAVLARLCVRPCLRVRPSFSGRWRFA
jgi:hypothetical protein